MVWNPLAKVPGLPLDAIYAEMERRGEATAASIAFAVGGVVIAMLVSAALVACRAVRPLARTLDARLVAALASTLLGLLLGLNFIAGFGMGMSLADNFGTDGGDATPLSAIYGITGSILLAAGLLTLIAPRSRPTPSPAIPSTA